MFSGVYTLHTTLRIHAKSSQGLSAEKLLGAKLFGKREEWEAEQPSPGAPSLAVMLISFPSDSYTTVSLIAFL